jgi:energy-coupling factor transport system ATP-binding protein
LFNNSVEKEVGFGPRNLRLDRRSINELVYGALGMTGLAVHRTANPYDLDVSVRKLVALAGVLAMEPPVLVMDEPTMGQDPVGTRRIGAIVDAWHAAGRTVIAITHDMDFAARHFERIVVMRGGEIILDGPPASTFAAANTALLSSTGLRPPLRDDAETDG